VCPSRVVEAYRQGLWHDSLFNPVDERMERGRRLTSRTTVAMRESGDLEVAEEVIHIGVKVLHATVVVVSSLVRDNAISLKKRLAKLQEERCNG
jgi:hypothetical protein